MSYFFHRKKTSTKKQLKTYAQFLLLKKAVFLQPLTRLFSAEYVLRKKKKVKDI